MKIQEMCSVIVLSHEFAPLNISAHTLAETLLKLRRLSRTINRLNTEYSNGTLSEKGEKARKSAAAKAQKICAEVLKCGIYIGGEPRGEAIGLILPSGRSNSQDGKTWRIDY